MLNGLSSLAVIEPNKTRSIFNGFKRGKPQPDANGATIGKARQKTETRLKPNSGFADKPWLGSFYP